MSSPDTGLLPCPFCNGEASVGHEGPLLANDWWAGCFTCDYSLDAKASREAAVAAWQRRSEHESQTTLVEIAALRAVIASHERERAEMHGTFQLLMAQNDRLRQILTVDPDLFGAFEAKVIEWANRIAGPRGGPSCLPDPVGILEMVEDIMASALKEIGA